MKKEKISIVIPCYHSEKSVGEIICKVEKVLAENNYEYEIILVDDGSKDHTYEKIRELAMYNSKIKGIRFSQNFGQHAALIAGYSYVSGDIIVGLNDDGEHDPSDIPLLINKIHEGYDYVCAKRASTKHTMLQELGSKFNNYCCIHLLKQPKDFCFSSYYAMSRFLINEIIKNKNPFVNINGIILSITKKVIDIEIPTYKRKCGKSGYSLQKSIALWANSFTAFSAMPLRISIYLGFVTTILSLVILVYGLISLLTRNSQYFFFKFICAAVIGLFGVLFLLLGIIGEYIARIYMTVNDKPQYVIRESNNLEKEPENE